MTDGELIRKWRKSILSFIEDVWKLTPQPLKKGKPSTLPSDQYSPNDFLPFVFGKHITWQQWLFFREIDLALAEGKNVFLSVVSGHGTGKSTDESLVIFWGLTCFLDSQIGCTAPTADQIYDVLWKEVARWHRKMPQRLADAFDIQAQYVRVKERPETWFARARTARKENPEALAGLHADVVIIIVDEASGVPEEIFEVAQGALTGKLVIFIMVSNPTRLAGFFYDSHHKNSARWRRLKFNSEQSPIVEADYIQRIEEQYGKDSPQHKVRVLGEFPDAEEDQLISRKLFDAAAARQPIRNTLNIRCLGIDVARYGGDRTTFVEKQGNFIAPVKVRKDQDIIATANDATAILRQAREEGNPYDFLMIDVIGLGAGLYDVLIDRQKNGDISDSTKIIAVNVSETPDEEDEHHNKRVELWHRLREYLAVGYIDERLRDDCCSIKYTIPDAKGRNKLELKEDTRERTGQSPDLGDAACLCFAVRNQVRKRDSGRPWREERMSDSVGGGALA